MQASGRFLLFLVDIQFSSENSPLARKIGVHEYVAVVAQHSNALRKSLRLFRLPEKFKQAIRVMRRMKFFVARRKFQVKDWIFSTAMLILIFSA